MREEQKRGKGEYDARSLCVHAYVCVCLQVCVCMRLSACAQVCICVVVCVFIQLCAPRVHKYVSVWLCVHFYLRFNVNILVIQ